MRIIANLLFILAGIAGLVPTLGLLTFWDRFPGCPDDLSNYQTLLGSPILAASLALIGAALTSWNQQIISAKQLGAQRREQDQALSLKRQQIASAFIGEIDVVLNELHEFLRPAIENALLAMESGGEEFEAEVVRIDKHLGRSFENSPTRVGLLPKPISGELMRFYYLVEETRMDVDWYYRNIEIYINRKVRIIKLMRFVRLLKQILAKLNSSENLGRTLLGELKKIRDTDLESPHQPETLGHRVRANCAPGNWYQKLASKAYENDSAVEPSNEPPRRPAKLRVVMRARSWLSRLMPVVHVAKLRLATHGQSWLSRLMLVVHAAKLRLAIHARSWLIRLMPFVHAAKLRLAMRAQSWLRRLMPFASVRFLVIFFIGVVTTLAWQSYGDTIMDAIARWSPHCGWRQAAPVEQTASASLDPPDQLRSTSIAAAAIQQGTNRLSTRDYKASDHRAGRSSRRASLPSSAGVRARKPPAPVR